MEVHHESRGPRLTPSQDKCTALCYAGRCLSPKDYLTRLTSSASFLSRCVSDFSQSFLHRESSPETKSAEGSTRRPKRKKATRWQQASCSEYSQPERRTRYGVSHLRSGKASALGLTKCLGAEGDLGLPHCAQLHGHDSDPVRE